MQRYAESAHVSVNLQIRMQHARMQTDMLTRIKTRAVCRWYEIKVVHALSNELGNGRVQYKPVNYNSAQY